MDLYESCFFLSIISSKLLIDFDFFTGDKGDSNESFKFIDSVSFISF